MTLSLLQRLERLETSQLNASQLESRIRMLEREIGLESPSEPRKQTPALRPIMKIPIITTEPSRNGKGWKGGLKPGHGYYIISLPRTENGTRLYWSRLAEGYEGWSANKNDRIWYATSAEGFTVERQLKTPNLRQRKPRRQNGPMPASATFTHVAVPN